MFLLRFGKKIAKKIKYSFYFCIYLLFIHSHLFIHVVLKFLKIFFTRVNYNITALNLLQLVTCKLIFYLLYEYFLIIITILIMNSEFSLQKHSQWIWSSLYIFSFNYLIHSIFTHFLAIKYFSRILSSKFVSSDTLW